MGTDSVSRATVVTVVTIWVEEAQPVFIPALATTQIVARVVTIW